MGGPDPQARMDRISAAQWTPETHFPNLGSGGRSPPAGRVNPPPSYNHPVWRGSLILNRATRGDKGMPLSTRRGSFDPPYAAMPRCRIYAEGTFLWYGFLAGPPTRYPVTLGTRGPGNRLLTGSIGANARGYGMSPAVCGSKSIQSGDSPPEDRSFAGGYAACVCSCHAYSLQKLVFISN